MRLLFVVVGLALAVGCTVASPLEGPGYDEDLGVLSEAEGPFLFVATHTRVAKGQVGAFSKHLDAIQSQQDTHPGFLARSLRIDLGARDRWTLSLWEDEEAVMDFVLSGAHLDAILGAQDVIDGVYSASWMSEVDAPPEWEEILERLDAERPDSPSWLD